MAFGGVFIAIPYFFNVYKTSLHPYFIEMTTRFGLVESHQPILGFLVPIMFIIVLFFFPRKWPGRYIFSLALFIAPFIVLNQQVITGKDFNSGHYHWFIHQPLAIVFLVTIFLYQTKFWQEKLKILKNINMSRILACLIILISFYAGIVIQAASYKESEGQLLYDQRYAPIVEWLNNNTKKEEVVLTDFHQSEILSIYTSLNQFYSLLGRYYFSASNERILNSLFLFYRLDGLRGEEAKTFFLQEPERHFISKNLYGPYYRNLSGKASDIPDQLLFSFAEKYQDFLLIPVDKFLKTYEVKYVVWDKKNYPQWHIDQYEFLNKVYENGDFEILIINK